jgi:hypothetical protein
VDNDDNLYFYSRADTGIVSLDAQGNLRWCVSSQELGLIRLNPAIAPTLDGNGNLYYAGVDSNGTALVSLNILGEFNWKASFPHGYFITHLISDAEGNVYFANRKLVSVSRDGVVRWEVDFPEDIAIADFCPAIGSNNRCYISISSSPGIQLVGVQ